MQILVFGHSTVYGAWDSDGGWVARLRKFCDKKGFGDQDYYYLFYNLGIQGETSSQLLERFEREAQPRVSTNTNDNIIIIQIGKNDSAFVVSKNAWKVEKEDFERNVRLLAGKAKRFSANTVFIDHGIVNEEKPEYKKWTPDLVYTNEALKEYDSIVQRVAKEEGVGFISVSKKLSKYKPDEIFDPDGLHLNNKGHKIVFSTVKSYLVKKGLLNL